jgi:hypothetical protein
MVRNIKKINKKNPRDKVTKNNRENFSWLFEEPIDVKVSLLQQCLIDCRLCLYYRRPIKLLQRTSCR